MLIDELELCGLLVNYCDGSTAFLTLMLTAPIHRKGSTGKQKWCNAKFLQICSDKETFIYILDALRVN